MGGNHLHDELTANLPRVPVHTAFGPVIGGRANNGSVIFLELPYALPPGRFEDPIPLPKDYRYENKEYIRETAYAVQPTNDGQAAGTPYEDKVGYGKPTENPLFLNIAIPPSFSAKKGFPVKVYVHGGFLQFGSPHSLSSQAQYIAAERSEIWVNIGYRLSVFGFLASEKPALSGNYGFKDQWLALEWIKENIEAFGGNPNDIELTGLSAGAHSVHQLLHHASLLPPGKLAPFQSAAMQSNAILTDPKTPSRLQPQYDALCRGLKLDPEASDTLSILRDPVRIPWSTITHIIETDALGLFGTFRGCSSKDWATVDPGLMEWQRSGGLARGLKEHGVKSVLIGDLTDEWYLYSIAHPITGPRDILPNLERYFPKTVAEHMIEAFPPLPESAGSEEATRLYGDIMSFGQVHLPVRVFARDMAANGFPVLRYEIRWSPEQHRPFGYVTHGCDRVLWALRLPNLDSDQAKVAKAWIDKISEQIKAMNESGKAPTYNKDNILTLNDNKSIGWRSDNKWDHIMKLYEVLLQTNDGFSRSNL
ncbi:carboxylesterase [Pholiota conissans]|uniref:Carboxylic ester hydrolase n=1 Tax=Pholiota conissans TaxID=109636 RepID=A0A9P6D7D3_9AGAR|nr:carboxylesterase [Pholiota conissans]